MHAYTYIYIYIYILLSRGTPFAETPAQPPRKGSVRAAKECMMTSGAVEKCATTSGIVQPTSQRRILHITSGL